MILSGLTRHSRRLDDRTFREAAISDADHQNRTPHPLRGYLFIASAALLWGIAAALGRAVFTGKLPFGVSALRPIDPLILSQTRTTFSLLVLLPFLVVFRGWQRIKLPSRDMVQCLVLGTLGVAVSNYFYYVAIQRTNVATAIIVQYTAPVWVLLYVVARRQQPLSLQKVAAVALAVTGIALVIDIFGAMSFAFYNVAGHRILARHDRWRVLVWTLAGAAFFWLIINPPWKVAAARYAAAQWLFLFLFSMVSVLGAFSLYFLGLQYLEPTRAIVASCLEPVFSILLAALLLGEVLRPIRVLGIVLVLAAILIVQLPGRGQDAGTVLVEPIE